LYTSLLTGDKLLPVSLGPHHCHGMDENPGNGVIADLNDTGDQQKVVKIFLIFRKNSKLEY
jgi:hypothetical protein